MVLEILRPYQLIFLVLCEQHYDINVRVLMAINPLEYNPAWYKGGWSPWRSWLSRARTLWILVGVVVLVCLLVDWLGCAAGLRRVDRLPYAGWLLEIAGVILVIWGLARRVDLFNGESIHARIRKWLREFPLLKHHRTLIAASGHLKTGSAQVTLSANFGPPPENTAARITRLERMVDHLSARVDGGLEAARTNVERLEKEIDQKIETVRRDLESVREQSSAAHVGDVDMELSGIAWVLLGLTLATIPGLLLFLADGLIGWLEVSAVSCSRAL